MIQKYEKSLGLGLGLGKKVFVSVLVLATKSYLHHCTVMKIWMLKTSILPLNISQNEKFSSPQCCIFGRKLLNKMKLF